MIVVADTGALFALYDADDVHHEEVRRFFEEHDGPLLVPTAILGELDYLLRENLGVDAELDFLPACKVAPSSSRRAALGTDVDRCVECSSAIATWISGWPIVP